MSVATNETTKTVDWIACDDRLPPEKEAVYTKFDDGGMDHNEGVLRRRGNLWFQEDWSMYVYYRPTHWAELPDKSRTWVEQQELRRALVKAAPAMHKTCLEVAGELLELASRLSGYAIGVHNANSIHAMRAKLLGATPDMTRKADG